MPNPHTTHSHCVKFLPFEPGNQDFLVVDAVVVSVVDGNRAARQEEVKDVVAEAVDERVDAVHFVRVFLT